MIKNKSIQLVYQSVYCTLAFLAILSSVGAFDYSFKSDFYIYYTNLSNYFCFFVMFMELLQTMKKRKNSYVTFNPLLKFVGVICILLTGLVFNCVLYSTCSKEFNSNIFNIMFHKILPVMFVLDYILFYKRRGSKWYFPVVAIVSSFLYVAFIFLRAFILGFNTKYLLYPYFFLDINTIGVAGVLKWLLYLSVPFVVIVYFVYFMDKIFKSKS